VAVNEWMPSSTDSAWVVSVRVEEVDGRLEIVGLLLEPDPDRPLREAVVTAERLRSLSVKELRRSVVERRYSDLDLEWMEIERPPGAAYPKRFYEMVASMYEVAMEADLPPVQTICQLSGAAEDTVNKWIRSARQLKLLGYPKRVGVAGCSEPRPPKARRS
jgi:hypothetical protein